MKLWAGLNWRRRETSGERDSDLSASIKDWGLFEAEQLFTTF
jgi:hypothetical protein